MKVRPWWEEWPGLLEHELRELDSVGIRHELDDAFLARHGVVKVHVWPEVDGAERRMEALFPDLYPWFRPEVVSPADDLAKHQGAFAKNLCLLPRESDAWRPGVDTLAGILATQLRRVYESQHSPDAADMEVHQAEPFIEYYDKNGIGALVVDSSWDLGDADHGTLEYGLFRAQVLSGEHAARTVLTGAVLSVCDEHGDTIATAEVTLASRFSRTFRGRWQRRPAPVREENALAARSLVRANHKHLRTTEYEAVGNGAKAPELEVVGLVFPIEAEYGGATADAWMFIASFAPPMHRQDRRALGKELHSNGHTQWLLGQRGGPQDLAVRVPQLGALRGKNVLLVGTGGLGAPTADHLAQSGANVRVVDGDVVEAATSVRFPYGYADAGRHKSFVVKERLDMNWPLGDSSGAVMRLGAPRLSGGGTGQHELLNELFDGVDLIFDATGSHAVGLFLSDCAARLSVSFVNVTTTFGCWGGRVMALRPKDGACFDCVYHHVDDRNTDRTEPENRLIPPEQPGGEIRPIGCGDATYTGTSFDAAAIVAVGVRAAVSLLCDREDGAYPAMGWNVATVWNRTYEGFPLAGRTFEFDLERHEDCRECRRRSG